MINFLRILLVLLFCSIQSFGQSNTDFQSRSIFSVDYKLNKKWKFTSEYRYSLENDLQKFRSSSIQLETEYAFTKKLSLSGGYRFSTSFEEDNHRFFAAINYDYKVNKTFTLSSNSKFQYSTNSFDLEFINEYKAPVKMSRQKIGLDVNFPKSKFSLSSGFEIFLKTDSQPYFKFNRIRYFFGTDYNLKRYGKLGLLVFYDDKYNPRKDDRIVLQTKYSISINDLLKNKKNEKKK